MKSPIAWQCVHLTARLIAEKYQFSALLIFCNENSTKIGWFPYKRPAMLKKVHMPWRWTGHYSDVIMTTIASLITSLAVVYSAVYSDADQRKHQSSASLAFVWGIHRDRWIPRTKGQLRGKCFHLMTPSWHKDITHNTYQERSRWFSRATF